MEDTIAAISTAIGEGGIAIVRLSGLNALEVADAIFQSSQGAPSGFPTHTIHFGRIHSNGNSVDQVMLTVMRSPNSYTTEDTVEINCHGGLLISRTVLALCLQNGARLAEPGEFTKRAFLNGRLDLTQAEAVMDLIKAKTSTAQSAAERALEGHLSLRLKKVRDSLLGIVAHIEAHIDFPDDDINAGTRDQWLTGVEAIVLDLRKLLDTASSGKVLREGFAVAIVGRPNAGKSSLMNALLGEDRAIVTPIPGTTRDTIEETANIRGIPVRLTDTAGLRTARGPIESIGINRSRNTLEISDLVLHVLDGSRRFTSEDSRLALLCGGKSVLRVVNKSDLRQRLTIPPELPRQTTVHVSATQGDGLDKLRGEIEIAALAGRNSAFESDVLVNDRQAKALFKSINCLTAAIHDLRSEIPCEVVSQQLRAGLNEIGEIVGSTATDDILKKVFSTFCIGK